MISSRSKAERAGKQDTKRLRFPAGTTSNEAEYKSLIAALEDLIGRIQRANRAVGEFTLEIGGDSALVELAR